MKNFIKWLGIIAFFAVIGFSFSACKKDSLNGTTWRSNVAVDGGRIVLKFEKPNVAMTWGTSVEGGTYLISGNTVTLSLEDDEKLTGTLTGNILTIDMSGEVEFTKQ